MNNIIFEDAKVIFPNFGGLEGRYNRAGNRCFSVMVTDQNGNPDTELAMQLKDEGWNIKERIVDGEPTGEYYINGVNINYNFYIKPKIVYVTTDSNGVEHETEVTEEVLDNGIAEQLDGRGAERYDISIRPRKWERQDGTFGGIKGYVDEMLIVAKKSLFGNRESKFGDSRRLERELDDDRLPFGE